MTLAGKLLVGQGSDSLRALCVAAGGKEPRRIRRLGTNVKYDRGTGPVTGYRDCVGRTTPDDLRQG